MPKVAALPTAATSAVAFSAPIPGNAGQPSSPFVAPRHGCELGVKGGYPAVQVIPPRTHVAKQERHAWAQAVRADIQKFVQQEAQTGMTLRHDAPPFEKQAADLVGQRGALTDKAIAHPVQCLDVELLLGLEFDKTHGRTGGGFGDRLGVPVVILLRLDVGAHILWRHQPDLMTQRRQRASHVMGTATRFHRHRAGCQPGGEGDDPVTTHPPSDDNLAVLVQADDAAAVLAQINAQYHDAHGPLLPPMNTDILHGGRWEGRAIHKGGPDDQRGRLIGRTKGGLNTKLHAVTDADGRPIRFFMTAGQVSDYIGAAALLGSLPSAEWLLADRGYDADWFRYALKDRGIRPVQG